MGVGHRVEGGRACPSATYRVGEGFKEAMGCPWVRNVREEKRKKGNGQRGKRYAFCLSKSEERRVGKTQLRRGGRRDPPSNPHSLQAGQTTRPSPSSQLLVMPTRHPSAPTSIHE